MTKTIRLCCRLSTNTIQ